MGKTLTPLLPQGLTPRSAEGRLQGKNPSPMGEGNFKGRGVIGDRTNHLLKFIEVC